VAAQIHAVFGELGDSFEGFDVSLGEVAFVGSLAVKFRVFLVPGSHLVSRHFEVVLVL